MLALMRVVAVAGVVVGIEPKDRERVEGAGEAVDHQSSFHQPVVGKAAWRRWPRHMTGTVVPPFQQRSL